VSTTTQSGAVTRTEAENTYTTAANGPAEISITISGTHTVLVTVGTTCTAPTDGGGCSMSFEQTGTTTVAASDEQAVGFGYGGGMTSGVIGGASRTTPRVLGTGTYHFKAEYRNHSTTGHGTTATFTGGSLIVQVY